MHPYTSIASPPDPVPPEVSPGATALPARTGRTRPGPGTRDTSLLLGPVDTAPADARATLRLTLMTWDLAHLTGLAETITSELVTNAITASRDKAPLGTEPRHITFRLTASASELCIRVWDPDPTPPPLDAALPADDEESGRGLFIVAALSTQWGTCPGPNGGKTVWASIRLDAQPPPALLQPQEKGRRR